MQQLLWLQVRALVQKNIYMKSRKKSESLQELLLPIYFVALLIVLKLAAYKPVIYEESGILNTTDLSSKNVVLSNSVYYVGPENTATKGFVAELRKNPTFTSAQFQMFANKQSMESAYLAQNTTFVIGIFFPNSTTTLHSYELRFPYASVGFGDGAFDYNARSCRNGSYCPASNLVNIGFTTLQVFIDNVLTGTASGSTFDPPQVSVQLFPMPAGSSNTDILPILTAFYLVMAFSPFLTFLLVNIVSEKEKKVKECMSMMGMSSLAYWLSWTVTYTCIILVMSLVVTVMAKFGKLFERSNFLILLLMFFFYGMSIQMLAYMITPFFSRTKTAAAAGTLSTMLMSVLYVIVFTIGEISIGALWPLSLLSPTAFCIAVGQAQQLENQGEGIQWHNMAEGPWPFYIPLVMLLVDCLIYFVLTFYFDRVVPGEYGTNRSPFYCLMPSYWSQRRREERRKRHRTLSKRSNVANHGNGYDPLIEIESCDDNWEVAIRLSSVTKTFTPNVLTNETVSKVTAVDNFSLDIYKGQITALLGHNGAGKTTIFNILAGFVPITNGTVTIYEYDVADEDDMDEIRKMTGVCPQSNTVLFDYMSVREHLKLYCGLKGIVGENAKRQQTDVLHEISLQDEIDTFSRHLSGGQKRKLCVGLAILGDPKILILDEPTAGMDPYSRRNLWTLLQNRREDRVTLLTTHFMDEADILADRKAIISKGKLRCAGSSLFLKNKYGVGYHLGIVKDQDAQVEPIKSFVINHIPDCQLKRDVGQEMSFILPLSQISKFPAFFSEFEQKQSKIGVLSYGVSMTTLEEVFLKLGEEADDHHDDNRHTRQAKFKAGDENVKLVNVKGMNPAFNELDEGQSNHVKPSNVEINMMQVFDPNKAENSSNIRSNEVWKILVWRVYIYLSRSPGFVFFSVLLPVAFSVLSVYIISIPVYVPDYNDPSAVDVLKPDYLKNTFLYNQPEGSTYNLYIDKNITAQASNLTNDVLLGLIHKQNYTYLANDVDMYDTTQWTYKALYNSTAVYSAASSINIFSNTLLANFTNNAAEKIITYCRRWPSLEPVKNFQGGQFGGVILAGIGIMLACCFAISMPVYERQHKITAQLRISGVSFTNYWSSLLFTNYILYLLPSLAFFFSLIGFKVEAWNNAGALSATALLLLGYGASALLYTYCCNYLFTKHETAMGVWPNSGYVLGIIPYVIVSMLDMFGISGVNSLQTVALILNVVFTLFLPYYTVFGGLYYISKVWMDEALANFGQEVTISAADYYNWSNPMVPFTILVTFLHIPVLWVLLLVITVRSNGGYVKALFKNSVTNSSMNSQQNADCLNEEEDDVREEREKVREYVNGANNERRPVVLVQDLRKEYVKRHKKKKMCGNGDPDQVTTKVAVRNLSLSVFPGEVMGLLGPNGAGKTTALNVLTADTGPTLGNVTVAGSDVTSSVSDVYRVMGYCPQTNPLWETLTLEEHLQLYAVIRGVKKQYVQETVENFLSGLAIEEHRKKRAKTLSGGTMRKVCFAMSMLGNPKVVFMDEPSTGMDPKTKRFMWNTISRAFEGSSRGAILTTHYMEEADALCSRVAIMVRGQLKCIGSTQHLKDKYGAGYLLEVKLQATEQNKEEEQQKLHQFVLSIFPSCGEPEKFEQRVVYKIKKEDVKSLGKVFTELEKSKEHIGVEEYSFSQSTLEQVFLEFAKEQEERDEEERKHILELKKKNK